MLKGGKYMCCWNFFGCGCRRRYRCGYSNYNNNYGRCRNYVNNEYRGYDRYNKGGGHGNYNSKDGYDDHKDHHSGSKCKQGGYSNY